MKLCIASGNAHKIEEIRYILGDYFNNIISAKELNVDMNQAHETGDTFLQNAIIKAEYLHQKTGLCSLADDSGLCVNALGGQPGVMSARYSGGHGDDNKNNQLLLQNMQGIDERNAAFVCAVALKMPDGRTFSGSGRVEGVIMHSASGKGGFGYDPLFFSTEFNKSFGECGDKEKNSVSHRFRALNDLIKNLRTHGIIL